MSAQSKLLPLRAPGGPSPPRAPSLPAVRQLVALPVIIGSIPFWIVRYLATRPPYADSLLAYLVFRAMKTMSLIDPSLPPPEAEGEAAGNPKMGMQVTSGPWTEVTRDIVVVPPVGPEWETAYAAEVPGVSGVERPGFVISPRGSRGQGAEPAKDGERIIIYNHGGAYIMGHPLNSHFPARIARDTNTRVFATQYRKCLDDASAFPAPLLDALAAWKYVTGTLGFSPSNVIVSGDSAGGSLSLQLAQQLDAIGQPLPGGLALVSPWCDLTMSFPSWERNSEDVTPKPVLDVGVKSALRHYDVAVARHPFFSPALADAGHWRGLAGVSVLLSLGTCEAFEDEIEALGKAMNADGVDCTLYRDVDGIHDGPCLPLQRPSRYEGFLRGLENLIRQIDIKAGGDGGNKLHGGN